MNHTPLVSILIANYNNSRFIEETLDSAINQTYKDIEIIIVDDFSIDNSIEVIERYIHNHPEKLIKLFKNETNLGCGGSKRKCIEYSKGELFAFLDPEDTIELKSVEILVNKHIEYQEHSIIYSNLYLCNEKLEPQGLSTRNGEIPLGQSHLTSSKGHISAFAMCKRSFYDKTLGVNPMYRVAEDQDMYMKMEEVAPVLYLDKALYYYRKHDNNTSWNDKSKILNAYWLLLAQEDAYKRRKKMKNKIPNLSFAEMQRKKLLYNLLLFEDNFINKNYFESFKYFIKSLQYFYVDKNLFILKRIKKLIKQI